jgi:hypothetical protein
MNVSPNDNSIDLFLTSSEAIFIANLLESIADMYQKSPTQLDPKIRSHWYPAADESPNSVGAQEWQDQHHQYRMEQVDLARSWAKNLLKGSDQQNEQQEDYVLWSIPQDQFDRVLTVLNDHRLLRAIEYDVMDVDMKESIEEIADAHKRMAMLEIHYLAWLIEALLQNSPQNP